MKKDDEWFKTIKWNKVCIECHKEHNGECYFRECAEMHYDENGNLIPLDSVCIDDRDYKK